MLGVAAGGQPSLLRKMADNFAWIIDTWGHIPNGSRTYYLSHPQQSVFALMVELFEKGGVNAVRRYLKQLKCEYAFWMVPTALCPMRRIAMWLCWKAARY
ncbi:hypothetical protein LU631_03420 [Erwinia tracheiphila]|uniref:trehalase family glycosidase n=1 Tax=Erwinia tracheiphila TaxID=65700 RepID=UPI0003A5F9CE|nr:trehalase family glycosidase [Erwinia tracheiphila]UIA88475.1 hypothetical protein LU631_03420 [Erwinia tracheiphila]UIA96853.1 hypothetical protein LU633_02095 [Erwinia tracheiphila]